MIRDAVDSLSGPSPGEGLVRAVRWMLLYAALHAAFRYGSRRGLLVTARQVEREIRHDLFSHVVRLPLSVFGRTATGDVMSRMTNDISAIWLFLGPGLLTLIGTAVSYLLALFFMLRISPLLTAVALAAAPAVILLSRSYGRAFHRLHRRGQELFAGMNSLLQENVTGIRLVKAYGMEEREESRFGEACEAVYRVNVSVAKTSAAFHGGIGFVAGAGVALVLLLGGSRVVSGRLTLGGFVAFNAYLAMLAFPTMALGWVINLFQRAGSATGRINEFFGTPAEERASGGSFRGRAIPDAPLLDIRNLSFGYPGEERGESLREVSFALRAGEVVGLVGPTGSGKSTLLALLLRLYPVPRGTVFWKGRDLADLPLDELRRSVRLVAQDPFLFSESVLENLCFGLEEPDAEAARRAAAQARLLAEIEELPEGFSTRIGERGITLSGGQKQRAAIARALCAGGELLLLDDVLSAVDSETEREIFEEILALRGDRTVLFSTHRMASLSRCDRILVMREGRIVEQGTHEELFALGGDYYDLYARQMLARELETSR
ncbi:MAG: ABC transporter ATP-binding protein [Deltaproteobacteria bacterium]